MSLILQELQNMADWQSDISDGSIWKKNQSNIFARSYTFQHKHMLYFPFHGMAHISAPQIMQKTECL